MDGQGSGVIINLSSTFGENGRPRSSVYSATKHFIEGFTKSIAVELAPRGVRVCAVGPTAIDTPLTHDRLHDPTVGPDLLSRIPLGRFGQVADVVGAVVFLASPAASLITGTTLMVDGGWSAQQPSPMTVYKCLVNGAIEDEARQRVAAGLAQLAFEHLGTDPSTVSVEFTIVSEGRWFTAGKPSQASMVLGTVAPGTSQETRVNVLAAMARLFCDATGADFDDVMVVAADHS